MRSVLRAATVVAVVAAMVGAATLAGALSTTPTHATGNSALQDAEPTLNRTYGGEFADSGSAVVELDDGYALVGSANRSARGDAVSDAVVRRLDANGSVTWTTTVDRPGSQRPTDAVRVPGGGLVVVGTSGSGDGRQGFAARLAPDGELLWYRSYGTPGPDAFNGVVPAGEGFTVAGTTAGTDGENSAWLVALDGDGVQQFARTYERQASAARDIARAGDGYVLAGRLTRSVPRQSEDQTQAWAARIAPNGNVRWTREYGTEGANETAAAVVPTADGYALAGESRPIDDDGSEARGWYAGLAENGTERWTRTYGSRRGAFSAVATAGEDVVLVGTLGPRAAADVTVVRARADGTPTQSYVSGAGESVIARDALAGNDSVVIAGTLTAGGDSQAWLLGTATPGSVTIPTTTTATTVNGTTTPPTATTATATTSTAATETPTTTPPTTPTGTTPTTSTPGPTDTTTAPPTTSVNGQPGFTPLLAVVALLAAAVLAVRRR